MSDTGTAGGRLLPGHGNVPGSNGDGVGDFRGLIGRLDYLAGSA